MTINERFHLKGTDVPFITALKFTAKDQYETLIYVRDNPEQPYSVGAKHFNIPTNTFKTRLHRARRKIVQWRLGETLQRTKDTIEAP